MEKTYKHKTVNLSNHLKIMLLFVLGIYIYVNFLMFFYNVALVFNFSSKHINTVLILTLSFYIILFIITTVYLISLIS